VDSYASKLRARSRVVTTSRGSALDLELIVKLSGYGLAMGIATVFLIPSRVEPPIWLFVFIISALTIALRGVKRPFLHGLLVSLANCVWVTGAHIVFYQAYLASHPAEAEMLSKMPLPSSPRLMMLTMGPLIGLVSGLVLGVFALIASKLIKRAA
jgi:hypothetical protein